MDRFSAIDTFVRVAETRSFAEAARQMRVSRSVVTSRIQQLEEFVGAPLFHRNTRNVRLSELGQSFLRDCTELIGRTNEVVDQMRDVTTSPSGRLRVHALPGFVLGHLADVLRDFHQRYPQIVVEMIVSDATIDPVKDGFDCAAQLFPPRSEELIARKLFSVRRLMCASPQYLTEHGTPRHPDDLVGHRIGWYSGYPTKERVVFHGPSGDVSLQIKPALLSNSVHLLCEYALEHAAIVCIPTLVASRPILAGELKVVLTPWRLDAFAFSLYYPTTVRTAVKLRLFIDALTAKFAGVPPWDEPLIKAGVIPDDSTIGLESSP